MLCQKLGVCVLTSEERPHKLRTLVDKWFKLIIEGGAELNHQKLLSDQGFLVCVLYYDSLPKSFPPNN